MDIFKHDYNFLLKEIIQETYRLHNGKIVFTELIWKNYFHLLCMIVLSARCKDKIVNKYASNFINNSTPLDIFNMNINEIEDKIKNINLFKNKAIAIHEISKYFLSLETSNNKNYDFNDLIKIFFVGRKTANVFLNIVYSNNINFFKIGVDSHVLYICSIICNKKFINQIDCEKYIIQNVNKYYLKFVNSLLIFFSRELKNNNLKCNECNF